MDKFKTLKDLFTYYLGDLVIDDKFCNKILKAKTFFIQKNDDHIHFFSEKLFGVYPVRWTPSDTSMYFNDICNIDEDELQHEIWMLPNINADFKVSSDAWNVLCIYLIHRVHHSNVKEDLKLKTKNALMSLFNYKAVSSRLTGKYFNRGNADKALAEATYNALSMRFDIKTSNGWGDMLDKRAANFINPNSPHYKAYVDFSDDIAVVKMINDAKGRINDTIKEISNVFYSIKEKQDRVLKSSSTIILEDKVTTNLIRQRDTYTRYIEQVINDWDSLYKPELVNIIKISIPTMNEELFMTSLKYLCNEYDKGMDKRIKDWVTGILIYTFELMDKNKIREDDLVKIVEKIRQNFMAGRSNDKRLVDVKNKVDKMIIKADKKAKGNALTSERVGLMIYVVIRTFTMNHYS